MQKKEDEERRFRIKTAFIQAQVIAEQIASSFNKDFNPRMLWDIYPKAFEAEKEDFEKMQKEKVLEAQRARRLAMMEAQAQRNVMKQMEGGE